MLFRSVLIKYAVQLAALTVVAGSSFAAPSAPDTDIIIDPVIHRFPVTSLNTDSVLKDFTIKNKNATEVRTVGSLTLGGLHPDQYTIQTDTCTGAILAANTGACTVSIRLHPTSSGVKSATLLIPSSDSDTPVLTAFVTTSESVVDQAIRRIPPVLAEANLPETMINNTSYPLTWSLVGYDNNYKTTIAFFDCTGISNGTCGDAYGSNFLAAVDLPSVSDRPGDWTYNGTTSRKFDYSYNFTPTGFTQPTDIVIRFYVNSQGDAAAGKGGLSLLIPGDLSTKYYDTAGRRIVKKITP